MRSKKSQSIFDYTLAFIALAALVVGIVRTWVWFNANYAKRQMAYQTSRIVAGGRTWLEDTPTAFDTPYEVPYDIGATQESPSRIYQPLPLNNNWVFGGLASGSTGVAVVGGEDWVGGLGACGDQCTQECIGDTACYSGVGDFNTLCSCYQACFSECNCLRQISPMTTLYASQIRDICGPDNDCNVSTCVYSDCETTAGCGLACNMRWSAQRMRDAAERCDDFWDGPCNWFGGGRSARQLRAAAKELIRMAWQQEMGARLSGRSSVRLQRCCEMQTDLLAAQCMETAQSTNECDANCLEAAIDVFYACVERGVDMGMVTVHLDGPCFVEAEIHNTFCAVACMTGENVPCEDKVTTHINGLNSQIDAYEQIIEDNEDLVEEIGDVLAQAAAAASTACAYSNDTSCYAAARNDYCMNNCCRGGAWGRACDEPAENCDNCAGDESCPACGLSQLSANVQAQNENFEEAILAMQEAIAALPACCDEAVAIVQDRCISNIINNL
ncbi:MAG: hypothetical protein WC532_08790 [Candidatus Omnitrophota bacterium]